MMSFVVSKLFYENKNSKGGKKNTEVAIKVKKVSIPCCIPPFSAKLEGKKKLMDHGAALIEKELDVLKFVYK